MRRQLVLIGIAVLGVSLSGCPFKKQPPVPQQGQAPTIPAPEPAPQPPPEEPPVEAQPAPAPAETQPETTEAAEKPHPKKKPGKKPPAPPASTQGQQPAQASAPPPAAPAKTSKLIIQEGNSSNSPGQLAAGVGLEDPSAHKQTTEELLQSTQANLNTINRPLSPEEQAMVAQIKDYMAQSRKATADSDTVRARNLALKAHLLSDELVKH